ncbi:MAG: hypothetical protein P8M72_01535 [Gammaproteobacteria bacterium]|nr:hypothetical protein [Gammaproteobacteria bacterium]
MKCDDFRELIEPLQNSDQGNVLPEIREQWEAHLHSCDACLEIFEQQLTTQAGDQFTQSVLRATSEPAAEVDQLLQELSIQLKSIEPPEDFLDSVLAQTASMQHSRQQSWQRWQRWKQVLMPLLLRPCFGHWFLECLGKILFLHRKYNSGLIRLLKP